MGAMWQVQFSEGAPRVTESDVAGFVRFVRLRAQVARTTERTGFAFAG